MKKRKDGRWCKTVTIGGERVYFYSIEPTEKKAIRDIEKQMVAYKEKEQKGILFRDIADKWDTEYREEIPDITYRKSIKCAYNRITDYFYDDYLKDISSKDIDIFLKSLKYGQKTVVNHKCILNMILLRNTKRAYYG